MEAGITVFAWVFDTVLALAMLAFAQQALASPDLFRAVVLFIVFGLSVALAWARLEALDVALAEVAVGAGLTGALLLSALSRLQKAEPEKPTGKNDTR